MIAELSYINGKSLIHIANSEEIIDKIFAIIGAIAFSIVTIRVMQEEGIRWQKIVFPIFDAMLVFLGFNLKVYPNIRIYLTVFMSVFTGLIMYSLGLIEFKKGESKELKELAYQKERANIIGKELDKVKKELKESQEELIHKNNKLSELQTSLSTVDDDRKKIKQELSECKSKIDTMRPIYIRAEKNRIKKKNIKNRTPEETKILESLPYLY